MSKKPGIPKGTRDFTPQEILKRQYITGVIRKHFERFGFMPIETPSFENSETLLGKYGEEGDRLIFRILNSGDFLAKADRQALASGDSSALAGSISEKALRYDLTVPFARYVVMHQNEIDLPFKRYQIQSVWRADRPQKGRFREFVQCDADVVGSDSLWQEVEFIKLYDAVFTELGLTGATLKINNRKILAGLAELIGASDKLVDFTVALDKLDKIGADGVTKEMLAKGITEDAIDRIRPLFALTGDPSEKWLHLKELLAKSEVGTKGVEELGFILRAIDTLKLTGIRLDLDVTLARGLNYYTGAIFEVAAPEGVQMGSIGGGGRYDDLTGIFGLQGVSGVGISFGLDRIGLVLEEMGLFPASLQVQPQVLFLNFGDSEALYAVQAVTTLREAGIRAEFYPEDAKMKKQMSYANKRQIPYVVLCGSEERKAGVYTLKRMADGSQEELPLETLRKILSETM